MTPAVVTEKNFECSVIEQQAI